MGHWKEAFFEKDNLSYDYQEAYYSQLEKFEYVSED